MAKYNQFRYGRIGRYGRYSLPTNVSNAIGNYVRYRMKINNGTNESEYLTMLDQRVLIPSGVELNAVRIRATDGEWAYMQNDTFHGVASQVRIRSIGAGDHLSDWVGASTGTIKLL